MSTAESIAPDQEVVFDVVRIQEILPHRYPFLMVDRVIEFVDGDRIVATKSVSIGEPYFEGHFPGRPVMPGVLIMEAMAQTGAILAKMSQGGIPREKTVLLVSADDFRWKKQVVPGDTLRIEMIFRKRRGAFWIIDGEVSVAGKVVAAGTISAMVVD